MTEVKVITEADIIKHWTHKVSELERQVDALRVRAEKAERDRERAESDLAVKEAFNAGLLNERDQARHKIVDLRAQLGEAVEALKPFAERAIKFDKNLSGDIVVLPLVIGNYQQDAGLNVGHCRHAASIIAKHAPKQNI